MLHRSSKKDNTPVIKAMDATLLGMSQSQKHIKVWLVMGPKVLAFQRLHNQETELALDAVDEQTLRSGQITERFSDANLYRLSKPIVLGQGHASNPKCFSCHNKDMGINEGEVIGIMSASYDANDEALAVRDRIIIAGIFFILISATLMALVYVLTRKLVGEPIEEISTAMQLLAFGEDQIILPKHNKIIEIREIVTAAEVLKGVTHSIRNDLLSQKKALDEHAFVFISETHGQITYVNDKLCRISGYDREDLIGASHRILLMAEHDPDLYVNVLKNIHNGKIWHGEIQKKHKSGGHFYWLQTTIVPIIRSDGCSIAYVSISTDITEAKKLQKALSDAKTTMETHVLELALSETKLERKIKEIQASETRIKAIVDTATDIIMTISPRGEILSANPAAEKVFGYSKIEMIGKKVSKLLEFSDGSAKNSLVPQSIKIDLNKTIGTKREITGQKKNGECIPLSITLSYVTSNEEDFYCGILRDLTEEKFVQAQLIQSEKLSSLGQMVAGVAHEINTPVGTAVTNVSELIDKTSVFQNKLGSAGISKSDLDDFLRDTQDFSCMAYSNLIRAAELVRSFKNVAVDQSCERSREFNLFETIEAIIRTIHHDFKQTKITFNIDCEKDIVLLSNPGAISQIISNLANNSRIHGFNNGTEQGEIKISVKQNKQQNTICLTYSDTGCGISAADQKRIFDPFFTTRRNEGGSGLGMHIVHNLVTETLGGSIEVNNNTDHGVQFKIILPMGHP